MYVMCDEFIVVFVDDLSNVGIWMLIVIRGEYWFEC